MKKILLAGESWTVLSIHQKGFDSFQTCTYQEGGEHFIQALEENGFEVDYMPCHVAAKKFPDTAEALAQYGAVILSDIGANTLLLRDETFIQSFISNNRLDAIAAYVKNGGGFAMMGGYMSFSGIDGKAKYAGTSVEEILPIGILQTDDRVEAPQGVQPRTEGAHPILDGIDGEIPLLLGYNKLVEQEKDAVLLRAENGDVIAAAGEYGSGRTFAFASDIAPHWAPPEFVNWKHYNKLFGNAAKWLCKL